MQVLGWGTPRSAGIVMGSLTKCRDRAQRDYGKRWLCRLIPTEYPKVSFQLWVYQRVRKKKGEKHSSSRPHLLTWGHCSEAAVLLWFTLGLATMSSEGPSQPPKQRAGAQGGAEMEAQEESSAFTLPHQALQPSLGTPDLSCCKTSQKLHGSSAGLQPLIKTQSVVTVVWEAKF